MRKIIFDPICNFLTIDFCENLQDYFFVQNKFLIIKIINKNECVPGITHLETIAFSKFCLFRFTIKRKVLHLQRSLDMHYKA